MGAPQIIVIVLLVIHVTVGAVLDGKPTPEPHAYRFGVSFIRAAIWAALLWWGGFFGGYSP